MSNDAEPRAEPKKPPRVPWLRRGGRIAGRTIPAFVWLTAAGGAVWLYTSNGAHGQALAYSEMVHHDLTPQMSGKLLTLTLEIGQIVHEGDVVATMDTQDVDNKMAPLKAQIQGLEARVKARRDRQHVVEKDPRDIAVAAALCGASPDRVLVQIDVLSTDQSSDRGESEAIESQLARLGPLLEQHMVTAERLDDMHTRRSILAKRIDGRGKELQRLEGCVDLSAEVELKLQRIVLEGLEHERLKGQVIAPVSGTIESVLHRQGEWLQAGAQIGEIVVPRPNRIIAYITDRQVSVVKLGMKASVTTRGHEGPSLRGGVIALGGRIEQVPLRLRFLPTIAQWGRLVTIEVEAPGAAIPGEIYSVSFKP